MDPHSGLELRDLNGNIVYESIVSGIFQGGTPISETADYYAVPLLAGQSVTVTLTSQQLLQAQIVDPDGRIIASDEGIHRLGLSVDAPFAFTADRPGVYKIGVLNPPGIVELFDIPYTLTVEHIGDMGIGAITTGGEIFDAGVDKSINLDRGDLGVIDAGTNFLSFAGGPSPAVVGVVTGTVTPTTVFINSGDLRTIQAPSIGFLLNAAGVNANGQNIAASFGAIPWIDVPRGNVGLISATDPAGILAIQTRFDQNNLTSADNPVSPIGGSFQIISGASTTYLQIAANGGIGTIRAANMSTSLASFIEVNADNTGNDGKIDMIDVTGSFGALGPGGPGFVTNTGGDIGYMRLGGAIFKDNFFGGTQILPTTFAVGTPETVTDDSGNSITYTPVGPVTSTQVTNPDGTTTTQTTGPQITLASYPVRDKGGQVPITVSSSGGLTVTATGNGGSAPVEIGSIAIVGAGSPIIAGPTDINGNVTIQQQSAATTTASGVVGITDLELNLNGPATIDVLDVNVTGDAITVANNTPGDLVDVTSAGSIGTLSSGGNIGIATPHATPAAILPSAITVVLTRSRNRARV